MKHNVILQIVVLLLVLHDFFYMQLSPFIMTLAAAVAVYGITKSLVIPAAILFGAPILLIVIHQIKKGGVNETFKDVSGGVTPFSISKRLEEISNFQDASGSRMSHVGLPEVAGTLSLAGVENFETTDASGAHVPTDPSAAGMSGEGMPGVSIPAYVREKGRMIVVPEYSVPPSVSAETNPRSAHELITGEDGESVGTALVSDATHLPTE